MRSQVRILPLQFIYFIFHPIIMKFKTKVSKTHKYIFFATYLMWIHFTYVLDFNNIFNLKKICFWLVFRYKSNVDETQNIIAVEKFRINLS